MGHRLLDRLVSATDPESDSDPVEVFAFAAAAGLSVLALAQDALSRCEGSSLIELLAALGEYAAEASSGEEILVFLSSQLSAERLSARLGATYAFEQIGTTLAARQLRAAARKEPYQYIASLQERIAQSMLLAEPS